MKTTSIKKAIKILTEGTHQLRYINVSEDHGFTIQFRLSNSNRLGVASLLEIGLINGGHRITKIALHFD